MYTHITAGTADASVAREFYDPVLGALEIEHFHTADDKLGDGEEEAAQFWVVLSFDREAARAFHETALKRGCCEILPDVRDDHPHDDDAFAHGRDGNKLRAVCNLPVTQAGE